MNLSNFSTLHPRPAALALAALVFLVYANSLDNGFHFDDSHAIVENHHIRSLRNIPHFFADPRSFSRQASMAMYRPLLLVSYALNYAVSRCEGWSYHLVNVGLHALAAVLVGLILAGLTGSSPLGWWGGLLFGLHPIHSQAVNYISSRSELLSAVGVLAAFYWVEVRRGRIGWGLAAHGAALLCKASAVALLPLLAFYEGLRPAEERCWRRVWPFGVLTLAYVGVIAANGFLSRSLHQEVRPLAIQIYTQLKGLVYYAQLLAMPVHLSVEHSFHQSSRWGEGAVVLSALVLFSLLYVGWRGRARAAFGTQGLAWLGAGLGLTFFLPLNVLINEHRLYLASVGLWLGVLGTGSGRRFPVALGWVAACVLALLTWERSGVWQSEYSLWRDAAVRGGDMFRVQSNLGQAYYERGEYHRAMQALERALALNPRYGRTWNNLGLVDEALGREKEAAAAYARALEWHPNLVEAHNNLGRLRAQQGKWREAEAQLRRALESDSHYAPALVNLGLVYQRRGRLQQALQSYEEALRQNPRYAEAYNNLGLLYAAMGRFPTARSALARALKLRPDYEDARLNLLVVELQEQGTGPQRAYERLLQEHPERADWWKALGDLRARKGAWEEAVEAYRQALARRPPARGTYAGLAAAYRSLGRLPEAIAAYEHALKEAPERAALHNNLASAYAAAGLLDKALAACRRALEIDPQNTSARRNLEKLSQALQGGE